MKTSIQTLQTALLMLILGIITKQTFLSGAWLAVSILFFLISMVQGFTELLDRKDK